MRALNFSTHSLTNLEDYYHNLADYDAPLPNATTQDFWKNVNDWIAQGKVLCSNENYIFNKDMLYSYALCMSTIFLTSSVTLLNDLTGRGASSHVKCYRNNHRIVM